jgi:malate dehydrogenase (quinone)
MLEVIEKLFPTESKNWHNEFRKLVPSYGVDLNSDEALARNSLAFTAKILKLKA